MRWFLILGSVLVVGYLSLLATLAAASRRPRPTPGLDHGRLRACPRSTNCACSEDQGASGTAGLPFTGDHEQAMARLRRAVVATGGMIATSEDSSGDYLHARYVSTFFGFIDDFEARLDRDASTVHLRSQSRVGVADRGVNRRRLRSIRQAFVEELDRG